MPKLVGMAQLSRPFQIAVLAVGLLLAVWVIALRPHSSISSAPPAEPVVTTHIAAPTSQSAGGAGQSSGGASKIYHGSAPGVEGLTRDIQRAHGAVAATEQSANQTIHNSEASSPSTANSAGAATSGSTVAAAGTTATPHPGVAAKPAAVTVTHSVTHTPTATTTKTTVTSKPNLASSSTNSNQVLVEHALSEGKVAVILFWNPRGADDRVVYNELRLLEAVHHLAGHIAHAPQVSNALKASGMEVTEPFAPFTASANQVSSFGTITRGVPVYSTPTLVIVAKSGKATVITGLTDYFSIEQAIDEARNAEV